MTTQTLPPGFTGPVNASSACPWCRRYEDCRDAEVPPGGYVCPGYAPDPAPDPEDE